MIRVVHFLARAQLNIYFYFQSFLTIFMVENSIKQNDISNKSTRRLTSNLLSNGEGEETF